MVLERWFSEKLKRTDEWRRVNERLRDLEREMKYLQSSHATDSEFMSSPTIIENINVEKVVVDRYEQSNNFGALGIKSLEGKLNIGANYGMSEALSEEQQKKVKEQLKKAGVKYKNKKQEQTKETPPKTTIRSRPRNASST